jgi:hypothetical protein
LILVATVYETAEEEPQNLDLSISVFVYFKILLTYD